MTASLGPVLMFLALQGGPPAPVGTGPSPSPVPLSWEIQFDFLEPRRIEVQAPGDSGPRAYWYLVYTATNTSDRTQRFFPTFQLVTQDLRTIDTDMGIHRLVFDAINERHRRTHPYLRHPTEAIGEIRSGDDHSIESVAIWRADEISGNSFTIYVAGLSGENRVLPNPRYDPKAPEEQRVTGPDGKERMVQSNPRFFTLRKTLEIRYTLPGSEDLRDFAEPQRVLTRWIMR